MSNLINNFPSKLIAVVHSLAENGNNVYTAFFADGTQGIIRTSARRTYWSVAQVGTLGERTDFLFSSKSAPALRAWEQKRHIVTVQVTSEPRYQDPQPNDGPTRLALILPHVGNRLIN